MRGKPLEVQYERTREYDMNIIEDLTFKQKSQLKKFIRASSRKFQEANSQRTNQKKKTQPVRMRRKVKKSLTRELGFLL